MTTATILVVDDNRDNVTLIDHILRAAGFTPGVAYSGEEGLRLAVAERPDVILLDLRMPGMDGYEVAKVVQETPGLERTRLIAVTASAMTTDRDRITAAGFHGYIQKPIDPESFVEQLQPFLPHNVPQAPG